MKDESLSLNNYKEDHMANVIPGNLYWWIFCHPPTLWSLFSRKLNVIDQCSIIKCITTRPAFYQRSNPVFLLLNFIMFGRITKHLLNNFNI